MNQWRAAILVVALLALTGCATAPGRTHSTDPWAGYNRSMYKINDAVDRATLKPIAKGYRAVTPRFVRTGVSNFFNNLGTPWVIVNEMLQGKPVAMLSQTGRLLINSTIGVCGLFDVATNFDIEARDEDFGQTLAVWGVPSGPYVVLPVFGPSTVRDGFGRIPDYFGRVQHYVDLDWQADLALSAMDVMQTRESLLSLDDTINKAFDPYGFVRDAWLQRREYLVFDGNPPIDEPDEPALDDTDADAAVSTDAAANK